MPSTMSMSSKLTQNWYATTMPQQVSPQNQPGSRPSETSNLSHGQVSQWMPSSATTQILKRHQRGMAGRHQADYGLPSRLHQHWTTVTILVTTTLVPCHARQRKSAPSSYASLTWKTRPPRRSSPTSLGASQRNQAVGTNTSWS